jgi:N6-L-threonylcarbamoyladenine synthase
LGAVVDKCIKAARKEKMKFMVVAGGVASNARLREMMTERAEEYDIEVFFPSPSLCTDNAAMIAVAGTPALVRGESHSLDMNAIPSWRLGEQ